MCCFINFVLFMHSFYNNHNLISSGIVVHMSIGISCSIGEFWQHIPVHCPLIDPDCLFYTKVKCVSFSIGRIIFYLLNGFCLLYCEGYEGNSSLELVKSQKKIYFQLMFSDQFFITQTHYCLSK
jgi:hypothetical protein